MATLSVKRRSQSLLLSGLLLLAGLRAVEDLEDVGVLHTLLRLEHVALIERQASRTNKLRAVE